MPGWALNFWKYMPRTREKHLVTYVHNRCFWVKSYTWFTSLYHILYFPMLHMDIIFIYKWNILKNGKKYSPEEENYIMLPWLKAIN